MTYIHAKHYADAYHHARTNGIKEWVFVGGPEELRNVIDFELVSLVPMTMGMHYVISHARARGGKVVIHEC